MLMLKNLSYDFDYTRIFKKIPFVRPPLTPKLNNLLFYFLPGAQYFA